ncbi:MULTISPECIES: FtsH protease activity modulator HflK [Nitrosomonas]|uniref:Protein HflK n=1 Tax=Nitrosomonas europaea (strain ATCC 19718 / CIP 103999 / KCTC 2705 / NBRC 14298) TaxID=228410 RepID=Q82V25_NITEU|nr:MULTISPECIES: FtsH protease activity modulator HflK [Nitrosomonas]MBV6390715.1 Modulator of FtsH protease HflK [Nitrosomonas europaea]QOJ08677.1 MAG: FtsH protease activity modulator HflK [Nitrosomonas sp. H1_AOB3]CAD85196.1 Band 7 protein [Nitrosomonas europaea ATCC 19718]SDW19807.1 protease FtsH subunit HflK [Nitrosomonas europaea]SES81113.1 protease FtsH subunit HflK [Nitrosomonas europaea]
MGLNDPQWGKRRGNSGPPDLEDIMRNFNQKISEIFGKKGGGNDDEDSGGGSPNLPSGRGFVAIVALLALAWIGSGFYIVDEGQRGVVLRFGKHVETTMPGLRWHIPSPVEAVESVNIGQVRTVEIGYRNNVRSKVLKESLILTDDENIVDIQFAVQYILNSPENFLFNNRDPESTVLQVAETAIRQVIGTSKMDFVLYEGREEVTAKTTELMQEILDRYQIGISINRVTMQNAQPPEQVQAAFDDAVKAGQDRERQRNEGQAYANDVIPRARGGAARLLEEAQGYKQRVVAAAEGDASRFTQVQTEYAKAPEVTRERMYFDTIQQVLSSTSKILIDQEKGGSNLLYLPLDKLIQADSSATRSSVAAARSQNESQEFSSDVGSRSRESFRSREREMR